MAAHAHMHLRVPLDQFPRLSWPLYAYLLDAHAEVEQVWDQRFGVVAAQVAASTPAKHPRKWAWTDFFARRTRDRPKSHAELRQKLRAAAGSRLG